MVPKLKNNLENILVFGGSGLLGKCLIENYINKKKIHIALNKTKIINKKIRFVRTKNFNLLKNYIKKNHIKVIINLAGLTNIELCEKNEKLSNKTIKTINIITWGITDMMMSKVIKGMVKSGVSDEDIINTIDSVRKSLSRWGKWVAPDKLTEEMLNSALDQTDYYGEVYIEETRKELMEESA